MLNLSLRTYTLGLLEISNLSYNIYIPVSPTTTKLESIKQKILVVSRFLDVSSDFDRNVIFTKDVYPERPVDISGESTLVL